MKKKMKKAIVLVLSLILAMGLFASCGGGGGGEDTEGKTSLTIAVDNDYDTLHPANWSTTVENPGLPDLRHSAAEKLRGSDRT